MIGQEEIEIIEEVETQEVEQHVGEIRPDDSNYLAFLIEQGDNTSKQKVKQAIQEEAITNGFESAEKMYAKILTKVMGDTYKQMMEGKPIELTKSHDFLVKFMKELAQTMDYSEQSKEVKIESNIRKLNRSELLTR